MTQINPDNERIRMAWIAELEDEYAPSTIDQKLKSLDSYEQVTGFVSFTDVTRDHAKTFVADVMAWKISSATRASYVHHVKGFFEWMVMSERIKGKQARLPIKSLRLTRKGQRAATSQRQVKRASVLQIIDTLQTMPKSNAIERRNRALIAATLLSGARDGAIISMNVGHVDLIGKEFNQHPDEVNTKASKLIHTWFYPVGDEIIEEVTDYITYLKTELEFTDTDPLFPATNQSQDENDRFIADGLSKRHWASAQPMREIFKAAFKAANLPYYNPHSFRHTLMALAYELELAPEALKAWSQNMGHEKLDTSVNCYGKVSLDRQKKLILELHERPHAESDDDRVLTVGEMKRLLDERLR
ncbi:MAG: tyrosine-type recombinase/integrase [Robiginitomaculum sp.]|nr:tyrosine-type recombinase/integrase [Robiginitomaculum sp.]